MAQICGDAYCALCNKIIDDIDDEDGEYVATTHFVDDKSSPLWEFSDNVMHRACFMAWELRLQFIAEYNKGTPGYLLEQGLREVMQDDGEIVVLNEAGEIVVADEGAFEKFLDDFIAELPDKRKKPNQDHG